MGLEYYKKIMRQYRVKNHKKTKSQKLKIRKIILKKINEKKIFKKIINLHPMLYFQKRISSTSRQSNSNRQSQLKSNAHKTRRVKDPFRLIHLRKNKKIKS